jgi:hypothetical protein
MDYTTQLKIINEKVIIFKKKISTITDISHSSEDIYQLYDVMDQNRKHLSEITGNILKDLETAKINETKISRFDIRRRFFMNQNLELLYDTANYSKKLLEKLDNLWLEFLEKYNQINNNMNKNDKK